MPPDGGTEASLKDKGTGHIAMDEQDVDIDVKIGPNIGL